MGIRTDIELVKDNLKYGSNLRGIIETARSLQSIKMAEAWLKYNEAPRTWETKDMRIKSLLGSIITTINRRAIITTTTRIATTTTTTTTTTRIAIISLLGSSPPLRRPGGPIS